MSEKLSPAVMLTREQKEKRRWLNDEGEQLVLE